METWLQLTAYKMLMPAPYPMVVASPIPYDLPFIHNTTRLAYTTVRNDPPPRSSKINDFRVMWKGLCDFLLVINSNLGPFNLSPCLEMRPVFGWVTHILSIPSPIFSIPNLKMFPLHWIAEILHAWVYDKANYSCKKFSGKTYRLATIHARQTTDRQTNKRSQ